MKLSVKEQSYVALLVGAIKDKKIISFFYSEDGKRLHRVYEPYICAYAQGTTGKTVPKVKINGYQISGKSKTEIPDWRTFDLEKVEDLTVTDESHQGNRHDYNPGNPLPKCRIIELFAKL